MVTDSYRSMVGLLLHCDGTDASTTFTDDSIYSHTATANGSAQIDTAQSKFGGASLDPTADGSRVTVPIHKSLQLLNNDWTIEGWFFFTTQPARQGRIFGWRISPGVNIGEFRINADNTFRFYHVNGGTTITDVNHPAVTANVWHHFAVSRVNGIVTLHIDGDSSNTTVVTNLTTTYLALDSDLEIGGSADTAAQRFKGWVDDFRYTVGVARYSPEFDVPTGAFDNSDPIDSQLLLYMDGTDASTTFTDDGVNTETVTAVDNAQIDTAQSKFGGASGLFDGAGDYLSVAFNTNFRLETATSFTLEAWVRITTIASRNAIVSNRPSSGTNGFTFAIEATTGVLKWFYLGGSTISGVTQLNVDEWYHVAAVKDGINGISLFVNGKVEVTTLSPTLGSASTTILQIGAESSGTISDFNGHIDDLRLTNGTARYASDFTVPTVAFPDLADDNDCELLLHFNGVDTSTDFIDNGVVKHTTTATGNAEIDTTQSKYGGSSAIFDGTGDYITVPHHRSLDLFEADFTIEFYARPAALGGVQQVFLVCRDAVLATQGWMVFIDSATNKLRLQAGDSNTSAWEIDITAGSTMAINTWYHIAVTRSGSTFRLFQDGTLEGSGTFAGTVDTDVNDILIGMNGDGTSGDYNGHIDDIRVTKGRARYTVAFTAPTTEFPDPGAFTAVIIGDALIVINSASTFGTIRKLIAISGTGLITFVNTTAIYKFADLVKPEIVGTKYTCVITGTNDGLSDVTIPISSIAQNLQETAVSSISVVCPAGLDNADSITARSNGGIIITTLELYSDGSIAASDSAEFSISSLQSSNGAKNFSVVVNGSTTLPVSSAKRHTLQGNSFISTNQQGKKVVRSIIDKDILPNDTVVLNGGDSIIVGNIAIAISPVQSFMSLTEQ